ncbi:PREDICTED: phosphatidylinositol N-acetylglucosaminyltransferase subunit C-like [Amphimedon queenslandica]|uniref:Phosphatidylinositol N-acetylglucosaminyltransferase subunit C n=1 Tax=Amphimedon queenslandica TaxID=400682 RepID=A0A1X7VCM9_AMPQE|nr:PREDICTED: phosphatidylinositol N-acetylglucosaminyltransferase subunit C-like [Amphimedon queenslandica]|eukprot:XP_019849812.1 PREDICTED: phosphatidylinositol N-acetylglucosaminyltransferase subunit C-like [Amphimedon queenslandica]
MAESSKPWKKILYERQEYPDNYLDEEQFRKDLKNNLFVEIQTINEVIQSPVVLYLLQEMNSVFLFLSVFWQLEESTSVSLSPLVLISVCCFLSCLLLLSAITMNIISSSDSFECIKQSVLFILFLSGTSPILRTLTESISTDSLWCMTIISFLAHLAFHKYGIDGVLVSEAFSLNAAIFAVVCLVSRLPSSLHAFSLILFAVILFALLPQLRNHCNSGMSYLFFQALTLFLFLLVITLLSTHFDYGPLFVFIFCHFVLVVSLVAFVKLQFLRNTIHGPWDEAAIDLNDL